MMAALIAVCSMCGLVMAGYGLTVLAERLVAVLRACNAKTIQRAALWLFGVPVAVLVVVLQVMAFGQCIAGLWGVE